MTPLVVTLIFRRFLSLCLSCNFNGIDYNHPDWHAPHFSVVVQCECSSQISIISRPGIQWLKYHLLREINYRNYHLKIHNDTIVSLEKLNYKNVSYRIQLSFGLNYLFGLMRLFLIEVRLGDCMLEGIYEFSG